MANRLFIYVPFDENTNSDIKTGAVELANALNRAGVSIRTNSNHTINRAELMFWGDEARAADIDNQDVLFVHGHGGTGTGVRNTAVSDNQGGSVRQAALILRLNAMDAAGAFYFAICYSAENGHIAPVWAANHNNVYGYDDVLAGALITTTSRGTVRNSMLQDGRLFEV